MLKAIYISYIWKGLYIMGKISRENGHSWAPPGTEWRGRRRVALAEFICFFRI